MISEKERTQMAAADLVVMPVLKGYKKADYDKWDDFRKVGLRSG